MSPLRLYAEALNAQIGVTGQTTVTEVEAGAVRKFARAIGADHPLYHDASYAGRSRFGAIIAPPTFVAALKGHHLPPLPPAPVEFTVYLHTDDVIESFAPIRVGDVITTAPRLGEVFVKNGRNGEMLFTIFDYSMINQLGELVATLSWTEMQCA